MAILLSRWEGFGLAIPEYMMLGKPIVEAACEAVLKLRDDTRLKCKFVMQKKVDVKEKYDCRRVSAEHSELFNMLVV